MAKISIDDKSFNSGVDKSEKKFSGFGKTVTGVIAGLGITKLAKDTIKLGIDTNAMAETSGIAWTTLLGSQEKSKKMLDDITKFAATTPFEKMGVDNMAKQLHNAGLSGDNLFKQLTKFGDIGGAFGIQSASLEEMVRQYSQVQQAGVAYTEDLNILQDRGVPIYKALAKELGINTAKVKKWASEGKITADVYQKALDSIAKNVEGGMAAQSKSFTGMISTFKDGMAELAGILAKPIFDGIKQALEVIQPKLDTFIQVLGTEGLGAALDSITPGLSTFVKTVGLIASAVLGALAALKLFAAYTAFVTFITGIVTAVKTFVGACKAATLAQTLWNMVLLANPIGLVIAAIGLLVGAFIYLWNTSDGFREFWINLWETVKTAAINAWNAVSNFFTSTIPGWIESFKAWWNGLPEWFAQMWDNVKNWFVNKWTEIWTYLSTNIPIWIQNVVTWWNELPGKIGEALGFVITKIIMWGYNVGEYLKANVPVWIENISAWFSELPGKIWTWLSNVIAKIQQWGTDMYNKAKNYTQQTIDAIVNWFNQLPGKIWTWLSNTISKIVQWGSDMKAKAKSAADQTVNGITTTFSNLPSKMWEIGKNVVEGLWNGIMNMKGWIEGKVSSFMNGIVSGAKKALGIHSPSRVFRDEVGKWIPEGVGVGIDKAMPALESNVSNNLGGLVGEVTPNTKTGLLGTIGNATQQISNPINLTIDNFYNNTDKDIEQLADDLMYYIQKQNIGVGNLG